MVAAITKAARAFHREQHLTKQRATQEDAAVTFEEKRAHPRTLLPIRPRVMFASIDDAGGGHVMDISHGGMLISTEDAALAWVNKSVVIHMSRVGIVAEGRVVRYDPGNALAVMFEDVGDPAALARLCGGVA